MLTIYNVKTLIPLKIYTEFVHPFYKDSVKQIFGVELHNEHSAPTRNRRVITEMLRKVMCESEHTYSYFLDIRLLEELGSPAPQYEILNDAGLINVMPICVYGSGLGIIRNGLSIIESVLKAGERAICVISMLSSAIWQYEGGEFVVGLEIESDGVPDGELIVKGRIQNEE